MRIEHENILGRTVSWTVLTDVGKDTPKRLTLQGEIRALWISDKGLTFMIELPSGAITEHLAFRVSFMSAIK